MSSHCPSQPGIWVGELWHSWSPQLVKREADGCSCNEGIGWETQSPGGGSSGVSNSLPRRFCGVPLVCVCVYLYMNRGKNVLLSMTVPTDSCKTVQERARVASWASCALSLSL